MARHDEFVGRLSSSKSTTLGTSAPIARSIRLLCAPIGTIYQLDDPFRGRRHDAGVLKDTKLYEKFVKVAKGNKYAHFNKCMSTVRQAVKWSFGKVAAYFAFVEFHKNLKVTRQRVGRMYKVALLLTNCRTCLYDSPVFMYFGLEPPSLSDYLIPFI
ncbi:hypothetical protein MRX96_056802 [Rhipicephalus microplus]